MSHLLNLPDDLLQDTFTAWVEALDLVKLDLSLCSTKWRRNFLCLLKTMNGLSTVYLVGKLSVLVLQKLHHWIYLRSISMREAVVCDNLIFNRGKLLLEFHTDHLETVNVLSYNAGNMDKDLVDFLSSCRHLKSVRLSSINFVHLLPNSVLGPLAELHIRYGSHDFNTLFSNIAKNCTSLKTLIIDVDTFHSKYSPLFDAIKANPGLTELMVSTDPSILSVLQSCCSNIESIELKLSDSLDLLLFRDFIVRNPQLTYFDVENDNQQFKFRARAGLNTVQLGCSIPYDNNNLSSLLSVLPSVDEFEFINDSEIEDFPIVAIAWLTEKSSVSLTQLKLTHVPLAIARQILIVCPNIVTLNLSTDYNCIDFVVKYGGNLTNLSLLGDGVTVDGVAAIAAACPMLSVVVLTLNKPVVDDRVWIPQLSSQIVRIAKCSLHVKKAGFIGTCRVVTFHYGQCQSGITTGR